MRMKQFWALLLALALLCSLALPAYAENVEEEADVLSEEGVSLGDLKPVSITPAPDAQPMSAYFLITEERFPNPNFRSFLQSIGTYILFTGYTINNDTTTEMNCSGKAIGSLEGIAYFPNLQTLDCSNNELSSLDLSGNTALTSLNCAGNAGLSSLDIRPCPALSDAYLHGTRSESNGAVTYTGASGSFTVPAATELVGFHTVTLDFSDYNADPPVPYPAYSYQVEDNSLFDWPEDLIEPEREGYWIWDFYLDDPDEPFDWEAPVTQDLVIHTLWVKVWTVSFDFAGGTLSNGAGSDSYQIIDGEIPNTEGLYPKKEGQIFDGWLLNGEPYEPAPIHGDITLVARWGEPYALHFDRSNAHDVNQTEIPDILAAELGDSAVSFSYTFGLHSLILSDDGDWQFLGWDTDPNAAPDRVAYPRYQAGASAALTGPYSIRLDGNTTLYSVYGNSPTITVNKNDGSNTDITSTVVRGRGVYSWLLIGSVTRSGYTLLGYSTDPEAKTPDEGLEKINPNSSNYTYYFSTEDVTLYAVWAAKSYTLSYNRNGANTGTLPESISFTLDDIPEVVLPTAEQLGMTKAHRVFLGWAVNKWDDVNYGKEPGFTIYEGGSALPASLFNAANLTLYAVWQYEPIVVSLDLNGYTGSYPTAGSYPKYYNYGATSTANSAPAGRPVTPLSYPGNKSFPEGYAAAEGQTNPFCRWMDIDTKLFYANGNQTNINNGTAVLPNDKDTELLGVWQYTFVQYFDTDGSLRYIDTVEFDVQSKTYNTLIARDGEAREGCEFIGWADEDGKILYEPGEEIDTLSDLMLYPVYYSEAMTVVLHSASVVFDGLIRIKYYLTVPDSLLADPDATVRFYKGDELAASVLLTDGVPQADNHAGQLAYYYEVVAKEINDQIRMQVCSGNGLPVTLLSSKGTDYTEGFTYSVRTYAQNKKVSGNTQEMRDLAKALEDYGNAAQLYFKADEAIGVSVSAEVETVTENDLLPYALSSSGTKPNGVTGANISVVFEADNTLRIYFKFDGSKDPDDYTCTVDGVAQTLGTRITDGARYLAVRNIAAKNLGVMHGFTISDGDDDYTVTACALSYALTSIRNGTEARKNLGRALYLYNQAATAYFSQSVSEG